MRNRHKMLAPVIVLDLTVEADVRAFDMLATGRVVYIHWGIPRGTGSRAWEIPLSPAQIRAGVRRPVPLRDGGRPWGLPKAALGAGGVAPRPPMPAMLDNCEAAKSGFSSSPPPLFVTLW